jgi:hypothetical protein
LQKGCKLEAIPIQSPLRRLSLFGSVLRDDLDRRDVDVLVEFEPGHIPGPVFPQWKKSGCGSGEAITIIIILEQKRSP